MAFQHTNLTEPASWVGFANFAAVFADPQFPVAVRNTVEFALLALVFGYPVPLIAAVLMSEVRARRGVYSALAYLPVVVPPVVAVLLWKQFYDADPHGVFNTILGWVAPGAVPVAAVRAHGHAGAGARVDLGERRGHGHHLSGCADRRSAASSTRPPRSTARRCGTSSGTSRCRSCAASCSSRSSCRSSVPRRSSSSRSCSPRAAPTTRPSRCCCSSTTMRSAAASAATTATATALSLMLALVPRGLLGPLSVGDSLLEQLMRFYRVAEPAGDRARRVAHGEPMQSVSRLPTGDAPRSRGCRRFLHGSC